MKTCFGFKSLISLNFICLIAGCSGFSTGGYMKISGTHSYICEGQTKIVVTYLNSPHGSSASLFFDGRHYQLSRSGLGGGTKFIGGNLSWWANGELGMLEQNRQLLLTSCKQENSGTQRLAGSSQKPVS